MFEHDYGASVTDAPRMYAKTQANNFWRGVARGCIYTIICAVVFLLLFIFDKNAAIIIAPITGLMMIILEVVLGRKRRNATMSRLALKTRIAHYEQSPSNPEYNHWTYYDKNWGDGIGIFTPRMAQRQTGYGKDEAYLGLFEALNGIVGKGGKKFNDQTTDAMVLDIITTAVEKGAEIPSGLESVQTTNGKTIDVIVFRAEDPNGTVTNWLAIDAKTHQCYWPRMNRWSPIAADKILPQLEKIS